MANPLDRTWYNSLIDDDGSGTKGTVWNKTQVDGLLDTVDASLAPLVPNPFSGALTVGSLVVTGGQIVFPASQNPSTNANTLDDYREGLWSPSLVGAGGSSGQVYAAQRGGYLKIGRWVLANFEVALSTLGTMTGDVLLGGIPFPGDSANYLPQYFAIAWHNLAVPFVAVQATLTPGNTYMTITGSAGASASSGVPLQGSQLTAATRLGGSLCYRTTA